MVLACITCENVVLFTAEAEILREKGKTMKLWHNSDVAAFLGNERFPGRGAVCANDEGQLVQRDEVRDKVGSDYIVQSVDRTTGHRVEVHPYLLSGFF